MHLDAQLNCSTHYYTRNITWATASASASMATTFCSMRSKAARLPLVLLFSPLTCNIRQCLLNTRHHVPIMQALSTALCAQRRSDCRWRCSSARSPAASSTVCYARDTIYSTSTRCLLNRQTLPAAGSSIAALQPAHLQHQILSAK